jgi:hypothetical protein
MGGVGLDVNEHEQRYFFQEWTAKTIGNSSLHNIASTANQAEAVDSIFDTCLHN